MNKRPVIISLAVIAVIGAIALLLFPMYDYTKVSAHKTSESSLVDLGYVFKWNNAMGGKVYKKTYDYGFIDYRLSAYPNKIDGIVSARAMEITVLGKQLAFFSSDLKNVRGEAIEW